MKNIPRIKSIDGINGFNIVCTFTTGERKTLDFQKLFSEWDVQPKDIEYPLLKESEFQKVKVHDGTLAWENVKVTVTDEEGTERLEDYEIDPLVLYRSHASIVEI